MKDGTAAFTAMFEAIEHAQESINVEFYKIASDNTGWEFAHRLAEKSRQGCTVCMIYDAIGSLETGDGFFDYLRENRVKLLEFNPYTPFLKKHWGWFHRDHRKMLIVDGRTGFIGGINLTDEYTDSYGNAVSWRDTDIAVEGPAVRELQRLFLSTWFSKGGETIDTRSFFPQIETRGAMALKILGSKERKNRRIIRRDYINSIKHSREYISIENAYFVPDRGIQRVLKNALKRGVSVCLILPAKSDIAAVQYASRKLYRRFLKWGARIFLWQGTVLHAKTAVIDDIWSTVGSFNIDRISLLHNLEVNVAVMHEGFSKGMKALIDYDLKNCKELDYNEWKNRKFTEKLLEKMFFLIRYWL
ncbi:MAG: phospholipase D-like domain-containing protein [Deltaproteobacteria bacterium]|nr:phospholipase D-like domain-containing protein [Deltaproteobacteria bacterium]